MQALLLHLFYLSLSVLTIYWQSISHHLYERLRELPLLQRIIRKSSGSGRTTRTEGSPKVHYSAGTSQHRLEGWRVLRASASWRQNYRTDRPELKEHKPTLLALMFTSDKFCGVYLAEYLLPPETGNQPCLSNYWPYCWHLLTTHNSQHVCSFTSCINTCSNARPSYILCSLDRASLW